MPSREFLVGQSIANAVARYYPYWTGGLGVAGAVKKILEVTQLDFDDDHWFVDHIRGEFRALVSRFQSQEPV